jgi:glycyl-tRNA synthetase beta chain
MHLEYSSVSDSVKRAGALQKYKLSDSFRKLVIGFKRVSNIIAEIRDFNEIDTGLFAVEPERELYRQYNVLSDKVSVLLNKKEYEKIMNELVHFGAFIDRFFDEVLVNTEDELLKKNRYSLLKIIRELFLKVADLEKIVS